LRILYTSRAFPLYIAGQERSFAYDPSVASFALQAESPAVPVGVHSLATVIFVPSAVTAPVAVTGARLRTVLRSDGSRILYVWPLGGPYTVATASP
jgi:hypothetical protein